MIAFLRGIVFQVNPDSVIIDVNGIGHEVQVHARTAARMPLPGSEVFVHCCLQAAENDFRLYGFLQREELELFKILLGVSGIGARGALNILGAVDPARFYQAVALKDEKTLVSIPGIGKKTAQRIIFELGDKIAEHLPKLASQADSGGFQEVLDALQALGYSRSEIFPLCMEMQEKGELTGRTEDDIKKILRHKALLMRM